MATVTKTFTFGSDAEGWAVSGGTADTTLGWSSTDGNTGGCLSSRLFGRNKSADPHWYYLGTWEDMGVPAGATVTHIQLLGFDWRCSEWDVGNTATQIRTTSLYDSAGTTLITALSTSEPTVSGITTYASISGAQQAVGASYQAANTQVQLWYDLYLGTGNNASATVTVLMDNFSVEITYTEAGASYTHTVNDSITTSDDSVRVIGFVKTQADTVTSSDQNVHVKTFERTVNESIAASETPTTSEDYVRSLVDTVTPTDSNTQLYGVSRSKSLSDLVTVSESTSIFSSNSMSGKIILLAQRIGQEAKALWTAISGKADTNHNHSGVYEPVISKATGYLTYTGSTWLFKNETYSLSTHNHEGVYQPLDADLTAIAALGFTDSALLRKTAANTWALDTSNYLTNITSTLIEDALNADEAVNSIDIQNSLEVGRNDILYDGYIARNLIIRTKASTNAVSGSLIEYTIKHDILDEPYGRIEVWKHDAAYTAGKFRFGVRKHNQFGTEYLVEFGFNNITPFITLSADTVILGNITANNLAITNWNTAYGWGNHALVGYLTAITKAMVEAVLTGTITSHNHSGTYEVPLTFSTGLNRATNTITVKYGTVAGTACVGNDARLSDARTPTDNSVTTGKLAVAYKSIVAMAALNVDWSTGQVFTKTLTANSTLTFSNLHIGVKDLEITGNYTLGLPTGFKIITGTYDGTVANLIQVICTNTTTPTGWVTISQEA